MQLSIVIVNYNVKYFLEHCLFSVIKACKDVEAEILVVDNNSTDGSKDYLAEKFPTVNFYWNTENVGFAKANNFALALVKGKYILFLNPDTIVPEDCFTKSIHFFETHEDCGAVGVRMIDGSGKFLKESKRGFPTPASGFFKMIKIAEKFSSINQFSSYYAGHLPECENNIVDVLAGAFMMLSKSVLEKTKGFDEDFFMYGEDIDLSYRIKKLGYNNYYLGGISIVHFKGESTQKKSSTYINHFYGAIMLFIDKHYAQHKIKRLLMHLVISLGKTTAKIKTIFARDSEVSTANLSKINTLIIATEAQSLKTSSILINTNYVIETNLFLEVNVLEEQLLKFVKTPSFEAIVFCENGISNKTIIKLLQHIPQHSLALFYEDGADSIIGSNNKNTRGVFITANL